MLGCACRNVLWISLSGHYPPGWHGSIRHGWAVIRAQHWAVRWRRTECELWHWLCEELQLNAETLKQTKQISGTQPRISCLSGLSEIIPDIRGEVTLIQQTWQFLYLCCNSSHIQLLFYKKYFILYKSQETLEYQNFILVATLYKK